MIPEAIADYACICGEGPIWHTDEKSLYWIDIDAGRLFRYQPSTGRHEMCFQQGMIGGLTIQIDGSKLLFMNDGAVRIWCDDGVRTVIDELPEERGNRFNDVIADPCGRVFCGTMSTPQRPGRLYRLDPDGALTVILENIGCSNGLGFTPEGDGLYYVDSHARSIYLFDYDVDTGDISNQRVFVKITAGDGGPDGLTVDADGHVWCAFWNGRRVVRYAPDGAEVRTYEFPARKVSSVAFGGADLSELYVTTACREGRRVEGEGAGKLFRLLPGARGVPEFRSRIGL